MALVALKCPNCGGDLQFEDSHDFGFCQYCGTKIMLQEALTHKVELDYTRQARNLLQNAEDYYSEGFKEKAYGYASDAVELDRTLARAWYIKAMCSEDYEDRVVGFKNALKNTDDPKLKEEINHKLAEKCRVELKYSGMITSWMANYPCPVLIDGERYLLEDTSSVMLSKGAHTVAFVYRDAVSSEKPFVVRRNCTLCLDVKQGFLGASFTAEIVE